MVQCPVQWPDVLSEGKACHARWKLLNTRKKSTLRFCGRYLYWRTISNVYYR